MDALQELIDKAIDERLRRSDCVASIPCRVIDILDSGYYIVEDMKNGAKYTVPNFSGSAIDRGENVQLFFKGGVITNKSAYIGAVNYKNSDSASPVIVYGTNLTGTIGTNKKLSLFKIQASRETNVILSFNANIKGLAANDVTLSVVVDENDLAYKPKATVQNDEITHLSFSIPLDLTSDIHTINIVGNGNATCLAIESSVYGLHISGLPVIVPTDEGDYIYETLASEANPIFYIGETTLPLLPTTLNGKNVKKVRATSFRDSEVINVVIPEGIIEIE